MPKLKGLAVFCPASISTCAIANLYVASNWNHESTATPPIKSKSDREMAPVTPVRGPRSVELGSGNVEGEVLIVGRVW